VSLALQFVGAIGILVPLTLFQAGRLSQHAYSYLTMNLFGSAVLSVVAVIDSQWGFVILQVVWALVAAAGLARRLRT
jgi:hypothetical protein